jgi:hypothetical protein
MWVESNLSRNVLNANLECLATLYWGSFFSLGKRIYFGGIAALNHRHIDLSSCCDVYGGTPTTQRDYTIILTIKVIFKVCICWPKIRRPTNILPPFFFLDPISRVTMHL